MKLKTSAQKIQEIFTKNKLEFQVIELNNSTRTAQDAANALSCEIAQIVKSLIFYENISHNPILILASGINKVNEKRLLFQMDNYLHLIGSLFFYLFN